MAWWKDITHREPCVEVGSKFYGSFMRQLRGFPEDVITWTRQVWSVNQVRASEWRRVAAVAEWTPRSDFCCVKDVLTSHHPRTFTPYHVPFATCARTLPIPTARSFVFLGTVTDSPVYSADGAYCNIIHELGCVVGIFSNTLKSTRDLQGRGEGDACVCYWTGWRKWSTKVRQIDGYCYRTEGERYRRKGGVR